MAKSKMYELNTDNLGILDLFSQKKYADCTGLTETYINAMFRKRYSVKLVTAKAIISMAYDISIRDSEQMAELLEKHFIRVQ